MARLRIFLCHASEDKERVRELALQLRRDGFDPWLDEDRLLPGQDWNLEIARAVRESDLVIVCISSRSAAKVGYVQKELRTVLEIAEHQPEGRIFVVPVRLEDCPIPSRLAHWQSADLFSAGGYQRLRTALAARLGEPEAAAPAFPERSRSSGTRPPYRMTVRVAAILATALLIGAAILVSRFNSRPGSPPPGTPGPGTNGFAGMLPIPGGRFLMGRSGGPDPEASPAHEVTLAPYQIDEKPVTSRQFREFLQRSKLAAPAAPPLEDIPATNVTWDEAYSYCAAQGRRLPTEAEWEFAARGSRGWLYPWGDEFDPAAVNCRESGSRKVEPAGARPRNRSSFGVLDMSGNVWQWCSDDYRHYPGRKSTLAIPSGAKVIRGGSFESERWQVTAVARNLELPSRRSPVIGFRCAK